VFVGFDERGTARYAALRGTFADFRRDADGSDKRYGFALPPSNRGSNTVAVFESAIDVLSHRVLVPDFAGWRLSLGGTSLNALTHFLEINPHTDYCVVCTDNDDAGNRAAAKIAKLSGITVTRSPPQVGKDWNDALKSMRTEVNDMEDVRTDIIFRDSEYKEKFRIKDGDSIKVTFGYDGEVVTRKCRWIDECHTKIGGEYYHNDEYAEKAAKAGNTIEPIASERPQIDILAAKYGEDLQAVTIPMIEAAIRKLVGGKFETETLYYPSRTEQIKDRKVEIKGKAFGAVVRGKDGIAVCGLTDGVLTSLHPYNEQTQKRELSPAEQSKKSSMLGEMAEAKTAVTEINAANAHGDKPLKRGVAGIE
jgi:DNA primase